MQFPQSVEKESERGAQETLNFHVYRRGLTEKKSLMPSGENTCTPPVYFCVLPLSQETNVTLPPNGAERHERHGLKLRLSFPLLFLIRDQWVAWSSHPIVRQSIKLCALSANVNEHWLQVYHTAAHTLCLPPLSIHLTLLSENCPY